MSSAIINLIAKKALKDTAQKNINSKDPYFEEVPVYGRNGQATGQVKKQKKGVPPGLSQNDGMVLKKVRRRAYRLDMSLFNCCGIRFGWSSVIGIVPVIGDFIDAFLAWNVVRTCNQIDGQLPQMIRARMYFNIMLDFAVGLVPFVGDLADAVFRANTRNAWILEEFLIKKAEAEAQGQLQSGTGRHNGNGNGAGTAASPTNPEATKKPSGSGLTGLFGGRSRRADEEMAMGTLPSNGRQNNS